MKEQPELSIVMPCLNEAETVGVCIQKALTFFEAHHIAGEVILADNGSTDGSQEIARRLGARVVSVDAKGYGNALTGGILAARGTYIIMGDSDDSYDFTNLMPFVERLRQGYDLVMGNRFKGGIAPGAMPALHKYLGNPVLTSLGRIFFKCPSKDFHCGLRGFSKAAFLAMDLRTTGMEFASEMVIKATLLKMRILEVPTTLSRDGRSRPPHLRSWRDGWRHLRFMLLYSPQWLFFYPGLFLMMTGLLFAAVLTVQPIQIGRVGFDVQTLLFAVFAVNAGYQSILFSLFAQTFSQVTGLVPADPTRKSSHILLNYRFEIGAVLGGLLALIGFAGAVYAVINWGKVSGFGPIDPRESFRIAIPAVGCMLLGIQTFLGSFFLGVLRLQHK